MICFFESEVRFMVRFAFLSVIYAPGNHLTLRYKNSFLFTYSKAQMIIFRI